MKDKEKQALIDWCEWRIARGSKVTMSEQTLKAAKITLAALTAQPVKLPKGFNPAVGDIFDKTAPVMRRDASDGKWLHKADVTKILNELGHEVQE